MEADYPAAHSMAVEWFAVDEDGHVGHFFSWESGAVPKVAPRDDRGITATLVGILTRTEVLHDLQGRLADPEAHSFHDSHALPNRPLLMFVHTRDALRGEIEAGRAAHVGTADGLAFILNGSSQELYKELHAAGTCRGCFSDYLPGGQPSPAALGLFRYEHPISNALSFPYVRLAIPGTPTHIDQLPPAVRKTAKETRLRCRFADSLLIQPIEHVPCDSMEAAYMDVTGKKIRIVPGNEEYYEEAYEELIQFYKDQCEIELPPQFEDGGTDGT